MEIQSDSEDGYSNLRKSSEIKAMKNVVVVICFY